MAASSTSPYSKPPMTMRARERARARRERSVTPDPQPREQFEGAGDPEDDDQEGEDVDHGVGCGSLSLIGFAAISRSMIRRMTYDSGRSSFVARSRMYRTISAGRENEIVVALFFFGIKRVYTLNPMMSMTFRKTIDIPRKNDKI